MKQGEKKDRPSPACHSLASCKERLPIDHQSDTTQTIGVPHRGGNPEFSFGT